jgi:cyclophilin family peptidyl-prolyl cis-trans isomerase/HEAT repeat protein
MMDQPAASDVGQPSHGPRPAAQDGARARRWMLAGALGPAALAAACATADSDRSAATEDAPCTARAGREAPVRTVGADAPREPAHAAGALTRSMPRDLLTDLADDGSLVAGLVDRSPSVRDVAASGLARLADAQGVTALASRVDLEEDDGVLATILFALGQRGAATGSTEVASAALRPHVTHENPDVREAAVTALGRLADDGETEMLVQALGDRDARVRGAAALALFRLDGRRYEHVRHAAEEMLEWRDVALIATARGDGDVDVRWRAVYAMAGVRTRPQLAAGLREALVDPEPLCRLFALRGMRALAADGVGTKADIARDAGAWLDDEDPRVVVEAVRCLARAGDPDRLAALLADPRRPTLVRVAAAEALRERLGGKDVDAATRASRCAAALPVAQRDASAMLRREAATLIAHRAPDALARAALAALAGSPDPRDRERAARLLADGVLADEALLERLLADPVPVVVATALEAGADDPAARTARLVDALASDDPAVLTAAAQAAEPQALEGTAPPDLMRALAAAHERTVAPEMKEARQALRKALGMPPDVVPPASPPAGRLLERLVALDAKARTDPHPRVRLATARGDVDLVLDRVAAPRHVASFLELAEAGFYDGLDFHRVVPDFVVQGLDPRGDGWGTGGRRLPDEFGPRPFLTGTLGMPHAGEPHTGGCQVFLTHLPTPHLDGAYTAFGHVVAGLDVVQQLEIGDVVRSLRRID